MPKILYVASRQSHIINFHLPYLEYFHHNGWEVHVLAEGAKDIPWSDRCFDIIFEKKITSLKNWQTIREIYKILKKENYQLISTHTTLAAFLTRIAVLLYGANKTKTINTCHGYLFSKNSTGLKKLFYITAEKICRRATQLLLVMNQEDYDLARQYHLSAGSICLIPGMGLPKPKEPVTTANNVRQDFHLQPDDIIAVYAAEFSKRKNQQFLIKALPPIIAKYPQFKLILAGTGDELTHCRELVYQLQLEENIILPGHVADMSAILNICQLAISASKSEGLPFNIMEAMTAGIFVLASNVKGHIDLVDEGRNGMLFALDDTKDFQQKLLTILEMLPDISSTGLAEKYQLAKAFPIICEHIKNLMQSQPHQIQ